ncbi:hypothetical protein [Streptomyces sp. NRRL F-5755]|uniref:hypothetical protein n=1 Tax=Streptomyces sp. NRRL F-5755 TaxID=1519475 RepID=UPI000A6A7041|nr:hypothetical protein [Streptomyces sp. NRRL F-5755]
MHHHTMLASLLPGFRHLRTPFATGVLCALQIWILFGEEIPQRNAASGLILRLYELGDLAGRPVIVSFIAFALYLMGDILKLPAVYVAAWSSKCKDVRWLPQSVRRWLFIRLSPVTPGNIHLLHELAIRRRGDRGTYPGDWIDNILKEMPEIRMRLIVNRLDVYMEHDRLGSEAEFRVNIAIYSVTLWIMLAVTWSPCLLFGFVISGALYLNGVRALQQANSVLVQALVSGIVESRVAEGVYLQPSNPHGE